MSELSKYLLESVFKNESCDTFHPWTKNCSQAHVKIFTSTAKGSAMFFTANYLIQLLMRYKKMNEDDYKLLFKNYLRSLLLGTVHGGMFFLYNCMVWWLLGRFNFNIGLIFIPFLMGFNIFIDHPSRREIVSLTFITIAIQSLYTRLVRHGRLRTSKGQETIYFMVINSLLMYVLKKRSEIRPVLWFFRPSKPETNEEGKICPHKGSCTENIKMGFVQFFKLGLVISFLKIISSKMSLLLRPVELMKNFLKLKSFRLAFFAGTYVGLYKAMSCLLCNKTMEDNVKHALLAGLISGVAYRINPNTSILFTLLSVTLRAAGEDLKATFNIPKFPYIELAFALCNAIIFHMRIVDSKSLSPYGSYLLHVFCGGLDNVVFDNVLRKVDSYKKQNGIL